MRTEKQREASRRSKARQKARDPEAWREMRRAHKKRARDRRYVPVPGRMRKGELAKLSPEARRAYLGEKSRHLWLRRKYGLTAACYKAMWDAQAGVCAICGEPEDGRRLVVDHCHATGAVRALLCNNCNTALGYAADDSTRLRLAADYLDRFRAVDNVAHSEEN